MGLGIVLAVIGAIMRYAISAHASGVDIHTVGVILIVAGVVVFVLGVAAFAWAGRRRTTSVHQDVHAVPGGQELNEQRQDPSGF
jgi:protein-S-isoprenylcysteine O-methyltransferase Ste14